LTHSGKNMLQWLFRLTIAIAALYVIASQLGKLQDFAAAFRSARLSYFVAATLLVGLNFWIQYRKWAFLLRRGMLQVTAGQVVGSILVGYTLGIVTPGRLGELGRGLFFENGKKLHVSSLAVVDKFSNNLFILISGLFALYLYAFVLRPEFASLRWIFWTLFGTILFSISFFSLNRHRCLTSLSRRLSHGAFRKLRPLATILAALDRNTVAKIFLFSSALYAVTFLQLFLFLNAFAPYPLWPVLVGIVLVFFFKTIFPVSLADLGVRETAAVLFLGGLGVGKIHAFEASLLLFSVNILLPSVLGLALLPNVSLFQVRKCEEPPEMDLSPLAEKSK